MNRKWLIVATAAIFSVFALMKYDGLTFSSPKVQKRTHVKPVCFFDSFGQTEVLQEQGKMYKSLDRNWWLNSGGLFIEKDGVGQTIQGNLSETTSWRQRYASSNPEETDNGYHPQNIFRLVSKTQWKNFKQEVYFRITADNLSKSVHRKESNGLLLFNRYKDGYNLYYTGLRVDGAAVIKKKINGNYFTMAYKTIFDGEKYDIKNNPNLLPKNTWIGLRSVVQNNADNTVSIKVYTDINRTRKWKLVLEAEDDGKKYGGKPFLDKQYAGIRTDFMDVQFDDYRIWELK